MITGRGLTSVSDATHRTDVMYASTYNAFGAEHPCTLENAGTCVIVSLYAQCNCATAHGVLQYGCMLSPQFNIWSRKVVQIRLDLLSCVQAPTAAGRLPPNPPVEDFPAT